MNEASHPVVRQDDQWDMPQDVFTGLAALAHSEAGLLIPASKRALVQSRVARRLRALGLTSFRDYLGVVQSEDGADERRNMVSVLTTNVSSFFREKHHFDTLAAMAPELAAKARAGGRVRIWSAGCSSGQEAYSVAMTLLDADPDIGKRDARILASDIDPAILEIARRAEFDATQAAGVPTALQTRYFEQAEGDVQRVAAPVRALVTFRELNLLQPWPMKGRFDAIFCRNVVIYFDEATQLALWPRFRALLADGGLLFVGHSERVPEPDRFGFEPAGVTTYRAHGAPGSRTAGPSPTASHANRTGD
ncbi:MAG: protein-glutamate O-methyltransferase CheR [Paracoccaceae bacterium]|nr:protein-glutamate O-methyltransferase CheR [Paracoccaceae bacterium]